MSGAIAVTGAGVDQLLVRGDVVLGRLKGCVRKGKEGEMVKIIDT